MRTILTLVFNFFLGVIGMAFLASQISSGKSISFQNGLQFNLELYNFGLLLYLVLLVTYFWGAKRLWGKTVGELLTDKILGKKKK